MRSVWGEHRIPYYFDTTYINLKLEFELKIRKLGRLVKFGWNENETDSNF